MTSWPAGLSVAPLGEWPGVRTPAAKRKRNPFTHGVVRPGSAYATIESMPLTDTLRILSRELRELRARKIMLLVQIPPEKFRLDGRPRADATATDPGIVLTFETEFGKMSYPCDTFTSWETNLRGIALGLEALRKVKRYGIAEHGEQYRAYIPIEAARAMPAEPFTDYQGAFRWLLDLTGANATEYFRDFGGDQEAARRSIIRAAKAITHPDRGGDAEQFRMVMRAEQLLRDAHMI